MNPFAMTDEDDSPPFPSGSYHYEGDGNGHHRRGPTTGSDDHPDGLPSRGINYNSIFQDQLAEGMDDSGVQRKTPPYDEDERHDSVNLSPSDPFGATQVDEGDQMPPDSEIPSIDPESTVPTANQSMYMSYRPSSSGSQRLHRSADSAARSDERPDRDLGSSSTPQPYDSVSRHKNRNSGDSTRRWKGKGRDMGEHSARAATRINDDIAAIHERGRLTDPFMNDSSVLDHSTSPPPGGKESRSPSTSSVDLYADNRRSGSHDRPRDAAAEKRNLLPMPVTSPHTNGEKRSKDARKLGSSSLHSSVPAVDVLFEAEEQDEQETTRPLKKSKSERHRHHKKRHHRKHSPADRVDDEFASDERVYPAEEYDDDPQAMLMSTRSDRNESRAGKRKRTKQRHDATVNLSEREKALWLWANVVDLDGYLQEVIRRYPFV